MSETMTMNKVIHGAVRRDLDRLDRALLHAQDGDLARARGLRRAYAHLHSQLKHHHEQEDRLVFPALSRLGVDTGLITTMDDEHHAMADALARTATAMEQYAGTGSAADATAARASLLQTREVVERHLSHEEDDLEPLILAQLESPEWKRAEKELRKERPAVLGAFFAWLTDGMEPESRSYFRSTVPPPVVAVLTAAFGRQYRRDIAPVWR